VAATGIGYGAPVPEKRRKHNPTTVTTALVDGRVKADLRSRHGPAHRAPLRFTFPANVAERWFPSL